MNPSTLRDRVTFALPTLFFPLIGRLGLGEPFRRFMAAQMQSPRLKQRAFAGYHPTAHDIFVCTFAKSGTNWMLQLAFQVIHYGAGDYEHIHQVVPWPDPPIGKMVPLTDPTPRQQAPTGRRVIKTHLESHFVPYDPAATYLIVVRDPKDILVSSYHFVGKLMPPGVTMPPVQRWLEEFCSDRFMLGSWPAHLAGYWAWRDRPNVAFFTFAEMKRDLPAVARRVAALLNVPLSEAQLAEVLHKSSFDYMKEIDHKFAPPMGVGPPPTGRVMMRRGAVGAAAELLTPTQQATLDAYCQAALRRHHCDFPYAEHFPVVLP